MRPTVAEQFEGLSRILAEVVAPEITAPYPMEILRGAIGALKGLGSSWATIPAFLTWDIAETEKVLALAVPVLDDGLAADIEAALGDTGDPTDWTALEARQNLVRDLLARAASEIPADHPTYGAMTALFRERVERFPFQMSAQPVKKA